MMDPRPKRRKASTTLRGKNSDISIRELKLFFQLLRELRSLGVVHRTDSPTGLDSDHGSAPPPTVVLMVNPRQIISHGIFYSIHSNK